jgi:ParB family chromosome partitioning protein
MRLLGENKIAAIVRENVTDELAERIVIESNLNQQSFADWKYSQQIRIIKMSSKWIQEKSQQGKRNDLAENATGVHSEHKSPDKPKRPKARDKISKQLGISPTVFERYRSIAKLDDAVLVILCNKLDEKRLGFMSAYRISQLKPEEIKSVINILKNNPDAKLKGPNVKLLYDESKKSESEDLAEDAIREMLLSDNTAS